ncbi:DegT/DnrJ/EryC1/StrS family aminotransferase [Candidatus Saccharibacteria bacterium]|nr:DegT/DnrJ/EryC1/StrS family aminotransferase [Candidatus Saccharibacteria bacterium]
MKHYFLGLAANYTRKQRLAHTLVWGREKDRLELGTYLDKKYQGETVLTKNGRSALAMVLKAYFEPGDKIIVNGFTCYAVYEALKVAGLMPVFADINQDNLNFGIRELQDVWAREGANADAKKPSQKAAVDKKTQTGIGLKIAGIIIQNTLGNPVDMAAIEKFAKQHELVIIEDLAHCTGVKYPDGREAGMVGAATVLSFGKGKSIDTISGGAAIFRDPCKTRKGARIKTPKDFAPQLPPKVADALRARFYPLFGAVARGLSYLRLGGAWMRLLVKIRWVEKSADNRLDLDRKICKFEAKLALRQLKNLKPSGQGPLRNFCLVENRDVVLKELKKAGFFFDGFWYERPVAPERYYKRVHFPENACPVAVAVSQKIINFPTHYQKAELKPAWKIVKTNLEEET